MIFLKKFEDGTHVLKRTSNKAILGTVRLNEQKTAYSFTPSTKVMCVEELQQLSRLMGDLDRIKREDDIAEGKIAVFTDGISVIVVGLDVHGEVIDPDNSLFGEKSQRNIKAFRMQIFDPHKGESVIVKPTIVELGLDLELKE